MVELYARRREQHLVEVVLGDETFTLSPGGQNGLIKQIIEEFCPRFTPGGHVLYVGDASGTKDLLDVDALEAIGVRLPPRGKAPDVIVFMPDRKWLILIEAASSHGPVDHKRYAELQEIFGSAQAGLVFVSCFPTQVEFRKYAAAIAWETDVWVAEHPSHMVHYNGDRFLGPR